MLKEMGANGSDGFYLYHKRIAQHTRTHTHTHTEMRATSDGGTADSSLQEALWIK